MATTFEKLSSNKVKLGFVVESEKFDEGIRKAYQRNVKKFNIPGFRRGKAPMKIIENYYGPGVFYEDAFDIIFPDIYRAALEEHDVKPVDRPELEVEQIERARSSNSPSRSSFARTWNSASIPTSALKRRSRKSPMTT